MSIGQGSGDFRETSGRVQIFHEGIRNSLGILSADAFTQNNPPNVTTTANVSTTLAGIAKKGVLGGTVAFTRPDAGNGYHGGAVKISSLYDVSLKPLGIFINDALGNPYENTPGIASGRGPYLSGRGTIGLSIWETQNQISGSAAVTYAAGNLLYASVNGLVTNVLADAYEWQSNSPNQNDIKWLTVVGIVKVAPDANNSLMVIDLRL
jgi:hypothetical protein